MTPDHPRLRLLVLSYEDLEGEEKRRADDHLAACAECRSLLDGLRQVERRAGAEAALPPADPERAFALGFADRRAAEESLAALRGRLGLEPAWPPLARPAPRSAGEAARDRAGEAPRPRARVLTAGARHRWAAVLIPVAAATAVAIALLWPGRGAERALVRDARLVPYSQSRGGSAGWHTGDAFALEFDLAAPARAVVFHVDPAGRIALLHPAVPTAPFAASPAGRLTFPPPGSGEEWRLEGSPGTETFLICATGRAAPALPELVAAAQALPAADREARVSALVVLLERRVGRVRVVRVLHQP